MITVLQHGQPADATTTCPTLAGLLNGATGPTGPAFCASAVAVRSGISQVTATTPSKIILSIGAPSSLGFFFRVPLHESEQPVLSPQSGYWRPRGSPDLSRSSSRRIPAMANSSFSTSIRAFGAGTRCAVAPE